MPQEVHEGDVGTVLRVTIKQDGVTLNISAATTQEYIFVKPVSGDKITKTTAFNTDGSDGQVKYTTVANDLDEPGDWKWQVHIVLPGREFTADVTDLPVKPKR